MGFITWVFIWERMTGKVQKGTRLPPDVAEAVEEYAEARGISEADALRRIIRDGLTKSGEGERFDRLEKQLQRPWWARRWL